MGKGVGGEGGDVGVKRVEMGGILVAEIRDREIVVQDWQVEVASLAHINIVAGRNLSVLLHFVLFGIFVGVGGLRLAWMTFIPYSSPF